MTEPDRPPPQQVRPDRLGFGSDGAPSTGPAFGSVPAPDRPRRRRGDVLAGLATAAGVALLGFPLGWLWSALAPRARVVVLAGGADLADPNTKAFIAADATFLLLTAVAGLVCGVLALLLGGRRHGVATAVGLAAGGLAASYVAWRVGHRIGLGEFRRAVQGPTGTATPLYLTLRAKGVLVAWALAGVLTVVAVAVHARRPDDL